MSLVLTDFLVPGVADLAGVEHAFDSQPPECTDARSHEEADPEREVDPLEPSKCSHAIHGCIGYRVVEAEEHQCVLDDVRQPGCGHENGTESCPLVNPAARRTEAVRVAPTYLRGAVPKKPQPSEPGDHVDEREQTIKRQKPSIVVGEEYRHDIGVKGPRPNAVILSPADDAGQQAECDHKESDGEGATDETATRRLAVGFADHESSPTVFN
ncbi:hypothetical protein [Candidatus Microthrix parvicella]|uniref:hypothetical protein n=1 Tax=Candidatus Neomicrothrix parvicella TaxID=41950 RepID=UPI001EE66203|nr:hypothetical protein [Candidatus Microthrix parvicella]